MKGGKKGSDGMQTAELYRSTNGGLSFSKVEGQVPIFNVVKVDPHDPNVILAGSDDGVYRSMDGGRSFVHLTSVRKEIGRAHV